MRNALDVIFNTYTDETPVLSLYLSGKQITDMTTLSDPQLKDTYNIMHMLEFTYNKIL